MKSRLFRLLLICGLMTAVGIFEASRAAALSPQAAASGNPEQGTAQDSSASASVSGNWQVSWKAAKGDQRDVAMQLKQDGTKLSGSFQGERDPVPMKGSLEGSQVSFVVKLRRRQLSFSGTVDGEKMGGTTESGAAWSATRQ